MLTKSKPKSKTIKTKSLKPKKSANSIEKEISPKSTKQSTPASNTPTNKKIKTKPEKTFKTDHLNISSDTSMDASQIIKETDLMKAKVLEFLEIFKNANKDYINQNTVLLNEVDNIQEEFITVKNEVSEILWESGKSKEELSRMKLIIESPKSRVREDEILDFDLSSVRSQRDGNLYKALNSLQQEITQMREKIELNELEIREKDFENSELKSIAFRLRDSLMTETLTIETDENHPTCTVCSLF